MELYNDLIEYLKGSQSGNDDMRKQSENEIRRLRDADPKKFVASLAKEIANDGNQVEQRQLAAVIFKNFIQNRGNDSRYEDFWINLDQVFKDNVKQAILYSLTCQASQVRTQVAASIAAIAKIEIPRKEWLDLIPNLCSNAQNEVYTVRIASLQCLQLICEEMLPEEIADPLKNQIIIALTTNIVETPTNEEQQKGTEYAVKAFFHALPFASQNFKVTEERDFIMKKLFEVLKNPQEELRVTAMQTLNEIGRQEYESIEFYFGKVCEVTAIAAKNDEQGVGAQGIEFWTSLAEEEIRRKKKGGMNKNYIIQCHTQLVELLLACTQRLQIEDEDDDSDEWGVALSAGCCLDKVSQLVGNAIMEPVIKFVAANIQSQDWKNRYSALISLGAITEGPDKIQFMNVIMPGLTNLLHMFNDPNSKVREAIAWVMSRICENHSDVISNPQSINIILPMFIKALADKPKVSNQICHGIAKLAESLAPPHEDQSANALTAYFNEMFQALFVNAYRSDSDTQTDLTIASFTALSALTEHCCLDSHNDLYDKLVPLLQQIEFTLDLNRFTQSKAKEMQDYLCGLLQIILVKVGPKVDVDTADKIVKLLILVFQNQKRVLESGLIAYSGLCTGIGDKVNVKDFGQYIIFALKGEDDECVRLACGNISDIAGALGEGTQTYLMDFMKPLLEILKDPKQDRMSKLQAIIALGDLAMNCPLAFTSNYLAEVLKILESACKLSLTTQSFLGDEDMLDYLEKLRETLIDCYTTLVHGVKQSNHTQPLIQHCPSIFQFMEKCVDKSNMPTSSMFRNVLGLVGDIADCVGRQIQQLLKQQFIEQLIVMLQKSNDNESRQVADWAFKQIRQSIS